MNDFVFVLGRPVPWEESLTCEFKEIKGQSPLEAIGRTVDEYVVAYLNEMGGSIYWLGFILKVCGAVLMFGGVCSLVGGLGESWL